MKYLLIPLLILTFLLGSVNYEESQPIERGAENEKYYSVLYLATFKPHLTSKNHRKEYANLYLKGNTSIFQWYGIRKQDSIQLHRKLENEDVSKYYSLEQYAIEFYNNQLTYYDNIGYDEYEYKEKINHQWKLGDKSKNIAGYNCKNAFVDYGGRSWEAWYTLEIPINAGPYKFKGLPGLIIKITDSTYSYDFEVTEIKNKKKLILKKTYHEMSDKDRYQTNRSSFNLLKHRFKSMSFNERISYMNRNKEANQEVVFTDENGNEASFRDIKFSKTLNLIEIDHESK
ncbi:GLPGLI family protein [Nonlabens sp.]|jgi:GLPGLI family protein|uniref:GLPGLI family protein n=1 Tax=Nonlabens sp. TaxID=1888209 RepID=UPI001BCA97D5|nr:GLPGLI family protein [Nonlabens sp.]